MYLWSSREGALLLLRVLTAALLLSVHGVCGITVAELLPFGTGPPELTLPDGDSQLANTELNETFFYSGAEVREILVSWFEWRECVQYEAQASQCYRHYCK